MLRKHAAPRLDTVGRVVVYEDQPHAGVARRLLQGVEQPRQPLLLARVDQADVDIGGAGDDARGIGLKSGDMSVGEKVHGEGFRV